MKHCGNVKNKWKHWDDSFNAFFHHFVYFLLEPGITKKPGFNFFYKSVNLEHIIILC